MQQILTVLVFAFICFLYYLVGKYGRDTALGFGGSILLAVFLTPVLAVIIIFFIKKRPKYY